MKSKTTVIVNGKKPNNMREKLFTLVVLSIIFVMLLIFTIISKVSSQKFANEINEFAKLNAKTVFSIDKIYMYSSADATSNEEKRAIWNLNVHQFTDIAIYINNRADEKLDYENSIKEMYIDNIRYANLESGNASLSFKNVADFGKMTYSDDNVIQGKLEYKVLNDGDMDYSKPQIYADASNPIILEYANKNIKENSILSDISTDLTFDGTLLRKTGVILSTVKCTLSFDVTIVNYYNQEFVANVYIDIPLEDTDTGKTIYDGKFVKKLENTNLIKFFRVK